MRHHYRAGFEWYDTDLDEGTALLHRLLAAAAARRRVPTRRPFAERVRAAIDDDLDAPRALEALDDLASAILSGGDDTTAPGRAARARRAARHRPRRRPSSDAPTEPGSERRSERPRGARYPVRRRADTVERMPTITITLPDGSTRERRAGHDRRPTSPRRSGKRLAKAALAATGRRRAGRPRPPARPRRRGSRSSRPPPPTAARCCGTRPRT